MINKASVCLRMYACEPTGPTLQAILLQMYMQMRQVNQLNKVYAHAHVPAHAKRQLDQVDSKSACICTCICCNNRFHYLSHGLDDEAVIM